MDSLAIAGIGEVLWDVLQDSEKLGGAPINFAFHAQGLGATSYAISTVGDDQRGRAALQLLADHGVGCDHITVLPGAVTGYVEARVDAAGVASYSFPDDVAWDRLLLEERTLALAGQLDAVCFGSLAQRSAHTRQVIRDFLACTASSTLKVFDMNIRQNFYTPELLQQSMGLADVVKLNDDELELISGMQGLTGDEVTRLRSLVAAFGLRLIVLTRGGKGSLLVTRDAISDHPGVAAEVVDTIGAGDSFTAATVVGLLQGKSLDEINDHANRVAAWVCSQRGAMVALPVELRLS